MNRTLILQVFLPVLLVSPVAAQSTEQRLWRLAAGVSTARGDELLAVAYEPGPDLYVAVDFVTRASRSVRSIGYFVQYARYAYDDGAFWDRIRNSSGSTGATVLDAGAASLAALGAVGKIGPVYGKLRPYGSLSVALFRNARGDLTTPGLNPGEKTQVQLGSKSGLQAGIGAGADLMGRRLGATVDAGYQMNLTTSRLDNRFQICDGSACTPAAGRGRTLYVRLGVALVRGRI